jgi:2-polyprenyl-3-methyl-5-hydroxy-6-metoxy-1,4-benzoquinol methylase
MSFDVVFEDCACPLGCVRGEQELFVARDRLHGLPGTFRLVRCLSCGLIRTNPRPAATSMGLYYPEDYAPHHTTKVQVGGRSLRAEARRLLWPVLRQVMQDEVLPKVAVGNLLEVGCASGAFMARMQSIGWHVSGIEASVDAAAAAKAAGLLVHQGTIENAPGPAEPLDLVVAWMALEHLHEPVLALKKLASWAKPGAWLAASTPNAAALDFRLFKERGFALQVPTHLYHYTPATLGRVLEAGGWELQRVTHHRSEANLVASVGHWLSDLGVAPRVASWLQRYPYAPGLGRPLLHPLGQFLGFTGQSGRMTVWARKGAGAE